MILMLKHVIIFIQELLIFLKSLCSILSQYWSCFMQQYHELISSKCENKNLISFLTLWQRIVERLIGEHLFHIYLNEDNIVTFLSHAYNLDVISLRIYVDIIMQFFISNMKFTSTEERCSSLIEEATMAALENKFFDLLPSDVQLSGFCILIKSKSAESALDLHHENFCKCDPIIVKKITFIFLNMISTFKDQELLYNATLEVLNFVKQNFEIPAPEPVYVWINSVFVDQDDILLGVMLALLKIYINLKKKNSTMNLSKHTELQNYLNPHQILIHFLQRLGFDHNELVAFLTSDETCFLLYIIKYLKLLLQEWDLFTKAHEDLVKTEEEVFESDSTNISKDEEFLEMASTSSPKKLVSYSSSSSEGDTSFVEQNDGKCESIPSQNLIVITTLSKLKESLKKLVAKGEFPYDVSPLIALLQTCESCLISE